MSIEGRDLERPYEADDRTVGDLVSELGGEVSHLIRAEMELARVEMRETAGRAAKAGALLGGGGLVAYLGLALMASAAAWGLAEVMPAGWAFLIVGLVVGAIGAVLLLVGRNRLAEVEPVPQETVETLKEDAQWARAQLK